MLKSSRAKIYKSQFTQWGVFKNNREQEAIPILRKRLEHSRKPIDVQLRGRCVQLHRLENYAKRKKITNNDIIRSRAVTLPEVEIRMPSETASMTIAGTVATTAVSGALNTSQTYIRPSLQNPNTPGVPELIFADIHHYMAACFESGIWVSESQDAAVTTAIFNIFLFLFLYMILNLI